VAVVVGAVGVLPWLSVKYVPVAAVLAVGLLWSLRRQRRLDRGIGAVVVVVVALVAAAVLYLVVHRRIYGGWTSYATGDQFRGGGELTVVGEHANHLGRSRRLVGLLVDDTFGLAAWAPAWLCLPLAAGALVRRRERPAAAWLLVALAVGWLVAAFVALTMHGWWWPGRQVVVVLPLGVIAVAWAADRMAVLRGPLLAALGIGVATWFWATIDAVTRRHVLVVDFADTANPWYRLARIVLPDGRAASAADEVVLAAWTLVVVALFVIGFVSGLRLRPSCSASYRQCWQHSFPFQ
jgi:hypothetical protein